MGEAKDSKNDYRVHPALTPSEREQIYGPELDPLVAQLFYNRGITDPAAVESFFTFDWNHVFDPFLLKDMDKAVERILLAISKNESILIYSDYDTDGIPGGAVLYNFFSKIGYTNFRNYIPNRNTDGYGLNIPACEEFVKDGVQLLITVDCGITDTMQVLFLNQNKIDVIITDHHLPEGEVPRALAVIDHKQDDCGYPEKNLCGCALAWKLACALLIEGKKRNIDEFVAVPDGWEKTLLDLVAISTICDMVPLIGENRLLVHFGKIIMGMSPRVGLHTIAKKAKINLQTISTDDIAFSIGPRINAASRLDDPMIAFKALAYNTAEGIAAAEELERLNTRRKTLSATIMKKVWSTLEKRDKTSVIVIGDPAWPVGILGLVAGKIADTYGVPTFVWSRVGHEIKGSCRSGSDISVFSLMQHTRESFTEFGGHAASGGFETSEDKIHFLESELTKNIDKADRIQKDKIVIDTHLSVDDVTLSVLKKIHTLEPFGMKNEKPLFIFKDATVREVRVFGKSSDHIEYVLQGQTQTVKASTFFRDDLIKTAKAQGEKITIVGSIERETYGGSSKPIIRLVDVIQ